MAMKATVIHLLLCATFLSNAVCGQDTSRVFTMRDFFTQILKNHPVAKQAELLDDKAKQELRISKGMLDPSLYSKLYHKEFQSKEYYTLWDNYLKIPTWYGIDFKAGFERNTGPYVNPENSTSLQGLTYAGISVPIGQGLLIDERRSQIRQAQLFVHIAEAEKVKTLNKLLLQASKDYWDWMYYYHKWYFYKKGLEFSMERFKAVKERALLGDLSSIDTVEAGMQVHQFQILLLQSTQEYKNECLILSNYLWNEDGIPLEINDQIIPQEPEKDVTFLEEDSIKSMIIQAQSNHPDLVKLNAKLNQLDVEKRFVADKFKPKINIDYHLLQKSFLGNNEVFTPGYLNNNYKVGIHFSYPLFLRNERGKFQLTKLKVLDTRLDLQQSNREIKNGILAAANELKYLSQQVKLQEKLVSQAQLLRSGEVTKFENGESSLFLINARETALINNQVKLYELIAKYHKAKVMLQWAAGAVE